MKKLFIGIVASSILLTPLAANQVQAAKEAEVKIQLKNYIQNSSKLSFSVSGNYHIQGQTISLGPDESYQVVLENGALVLYKGSQRMSSLGSSATFIPVVYGESNFLTISGRKYIGTMQFTIESQKYIRPINTLLMEDYLKGVLPYEMSESWGSNGGLEALKAQAVAARTFASRYANTTMTDTTSHQVYGGHTNLPNVNAAVKATKDMVAKHDGKLIETYFSATNGGKVLSNVNSWGGVSVPYLVLKDDPYDARSGNQYLNWNFTIAKTQIDLSSYDTKNPSLWWGKVEELSADKEKLTNAKNWLVTNGFVTSKYEMKITAVPSIWFDTNIVNGKRIDGKVTFHYILRDKNTNTFVMENGIIKVHEVTIDRRAYDIRFMFGTAIMKGPQVKSVQNVEGIWSVVGMGWGHGIGMSQYGAYQMSKEGISYPTILQFYYPSTNLVDEIEPRISNGHVTVGDNSGTVSFEMDEQTSVVVELIHLESNKKTTLSNQWRPVGKHAVNFNTNTLQGQYKVSISATDGSKNVGTQVLDTLLTFEQNAPIETVNVALRLTEQTKLLTEPNSNSKSNGTLSPQNVQAIKKSGNFYQIKTWIGPQWILPNDPIIGNIVVFDKKLILANRTPLYLLPFKGHQTGGTLSPQSVQVVERWGTTDWYNIQTWEGNRWVQVLNPVFEEPIESFNQKITLISRTSLYPSSSITTGNYGTVSPQTVQALRKRGDSIEISTWQGPMWIHQGKYILGEIVSSNETVAIQKRTNLYLEPNNNTFSGATISPQNVVTVQKISNSNWIKINSYIGYVWLQK